MQKWTKYCKTPIRVIFNWAVLHHHKATDIWRPNFSRFKIIFQFAKIVAQKYHLKCHQYSVLLKRCTIFFQIAGSKVKWMMILIWEPLHHHKPTDIWRPNYFSRFKIIFKFAKIVAQNYYLKCHQYSVLLKRCTIFFKNI